MGGGFSVCPLPPCRSPAFPNRPLTVPASTFPSKHFYPHGAPFSLSHIYIRVVTSGIQSIAIYCNISIDRKRIHDWSRQSRQYQHFTTSDLLLPIACLRRSISFYTQGVPGFVQSDIKLPPGCNPDISVSVAGPRSIWTISRIYSWAFDYLSTPPSAVPGGPFRTKQSCRADSCRENAKASPFKSAPVRHSRFQDSSGSILPPKLSA